MNAGIYPRVSRGRVPALEKVIEVAQILHCCVCRFHWIETLVDVAVGYEAILFACVEHKLP